ncbi:hypothetical protein [Ruminiclostridium herbifermentans]|uniref:hypothetical protein n=1 Tax=Ruminiclostridium herbifermentans TaxID=2488810 RepID=UPI001FCFDF71|nr:hypothetical protein [Ruminiclostridium herbifermentans]
MSGSNSIRFTSSWSGFTSKSPLYAEICNDTGIYKSLMIAGNRSGGYERRVSMWDDVDVNGDLRVDSNIKVEGAIIPGVGECEVNGNYV